MVPQVGSSIPPRVSQKRAILLVTFCAVAISLLDLTITQLSGQVWAYLLPIFPVIIFTVGFGLKSRILGYSFAVAYSVTCFGWMVAGIAIGGDIGIVAFLVGVTALAITLSVFAIIWLIFWKMWRGLSSMKRNGGEIKPQELE